MKPKNKAFTFTELLVVILIMGILPAIAIVLQKRINTAKAEATFINIKQIGIEKAEKLYAGNNIVYGTKHNMFTQEQVDAEQEKYQTTKAQSALLRILSKGIENLSVEELEALRHAILEKKSHSKEEINNLQERYERIRINERDTRLKQIDPNQQ